MRRTTLPAALALAALGVAGAVHALDTGMASPTEANRALGEAGRALAEARHRAETLDRAARDAAAAADRTAREAAATAARIRETEAEIALARAEIAAIDRQRAGLRADIARHEAPLVRLTAALQLMARRPLGFSLLRADSLQQTVWLRATLQTMLPQVAAQTADLRSRIAQGRQLQDRARALAASLGASERDLAARRTSLAALESRQRIAQRAASGSAGREADRVLALAEQTRDLGALVTRLAGDDRLAAQLAALPGPMPRPGAAGVAPGRMLLAAPLGGNAPLAVFSGIVPVGGRLVSGFGEGGGSDHGVVIAPAPGAQIVAPAAGRVAFAGPYRGYDRIVIVAHEGGWTSLITGLGRVDVATGDTLVEGAPLGIAAQGHPRALIELRKDGQPVNPLAYLRP